MKKAGAPDVETSREAWNGFSTFQQGTLAMGSLKTL